MLVGTANAESPMVAAGQYIIVSSEPSSAKALGQGGLSAVLATSKRTSLVVDIPQTAKASSAVKGGDTVEVVPYNEARTKAFCAELKANNSSIAVCEPNYVYTTSVAPNDVSYGSLWGLSKISAPAAWELTTGSSNVVVAVVDTGIDYTHPDLQDNMWRNPGEIAGNGIDDDGNGYVDDIFGVNTRSGTGDPYDDNGHGTHCAGTIGAQGNNGTGVVGVAWDVKLMALKFLASNGSGTTYHAISAIDYAVENGANVISASWGGTGYSQALHDSIQRARDAGVLFIAAAGNSSSDNDLIQHYPSGYALSNIISVAATDRDDNLAYFSNYGAASVHVAAPGVGIYSTYPGSSYSSLSGTSMATPHVAGLAALALSLHPNENFSQIKQRIVGNGDALNSLTGLISSNRRINAYSALSGEPSGGGSSDTASIVSLTGPLKLNRWFDSLLVGEANTSVETTLTISGWFGQESCSLGSVTFDETGVATLSARLILKDALRYAERATLSVGSDNKRRRIVRASANSSGAYNKKHQRKLSKDSSRYADSVAESCARIVSTLQVN